jgi:hypothetical protein
MVCSDFVTRSFLTKALCKFSFLCDCRPFHLLTRPKYNLKVGK